jgi:integrase
MSLFSTNDAFDPSRVQSENRHRCFRMRYGRARIEIDLDLTPEESENAQRYIAVVVNSGKQPSRALVSPLPKPQPTDTQSPRLSKAVEFYLDNLTQRKRGVSTLKANRNTLRILMAVAGDIPISQIDYQVIAEFRKQVRWWPRKAMSRKDLRELTPKEMLEVGIREACPEPYKQATINMHMGVLNAFFQTYLKVGKVPLNPTDIFKQDDARNKLPKTRFPLNPQELGTIFDPVAFKVWAAVFPHRWWIPQIALYTGARVEEIAQLRAADIREDQGVMCFFLKELDEDSDTKVEGMRDKAFKNTVSQRVVPIAKPLIEAGILDYVQEVRDAGLMRLFPQLKAGISPKTGELNGSGYSVGHIRQFGDFLREHTDMKVGVGTHAFRHTIASALNFAGEADSVIASITGHGISGEKYKNLACYTTKEHDATLRPKQVVALAKFKPEVVLPQYVPGQFDHCLGPDAKRHP